MLEYGAGRRSFFLRNRRLPSVLVRCEHFVAGQRPEEFQFLIGALQRGAGVAPAQKVREDLPWHRPAVEPVIVELCGVVAKEMPEGGSVKCSASAGPDAKQVRLPEKR